MEPAGSSHSFPMGVLSITITLNWGRERLNLALREAASAGVCGLSNTSPRVEQKAEARQAFRAQKFSFPLTRRMRRLPTATKL